MKVSREEKKLEAIKRMKALKLFAPCVRAFKNDDEVQLTEPFGGLYEFSSNEELNRYIEDFETEYSALVYHVIHSAFNVDGDVWEMYHLLYVSDHTDEWEMDHEDIEQGYVMAYVVNNTIPDYSEFGTIAVANRIGGLVRVG